MYIYYDSHNSHQMHGYLHIVYMGCLNQSPVELQSKVHCMTKSMWTPARRTSHSKIMGLNMELVPPWLPSLFWEVFPLDVGTLPQGLASIQPRALVRSGTDVGRLGLAPSRCSYLYLLWNPISCCSYTILKTLQYIQNRFHNTLSVCPQAPTLLPHIYNTKSMYTCVYSCVSAYFGVVSQSPLFHKVYFYQLKKNLILLLASVTM